MKSILKSLSEHGTFIQPDALNYISSKEKPKEFVSLLIKNLQEYPLVLTVDHIKNIEQTTMIKEPTKPETSVKEQVTEDKEIQKTLLSKIYNAPHLKGEIFEENNEEYEDLDKEDQLQLSTDEMEEKIPHAIEIIKGDGEAPKVGDIITMHFIGTLIDGTEFGNSYIQGSPIEVVWGREQLLPGWEEGIGLMRTGEKAKFIISAELGFGTQDFGVVPGEQLVTTPLGGITTGTEAEQASRKKRER